jgi:hypothetical protein
VLEIPNKGNLHDVFYVLCLKKNLGPTTPIQTQLPLLDEEGRLTLKPKGILEVKTKVLHSRSINEYLIKWKNLSKDEATWKMKILYRVIHPFPCFKVKEFQAEMTYNKPNIVYLIIVIIQWSM